MTLKLWINYLIACEYWYPYYSELGFTFRIDISPQKFQGATLFMGSFFFFNLLLQLLESRFAQKVGWSLPTSSNKITEAHQTVNTHNYR